MSDSSKEARQSLHALIRWLRTEGPPRALDRVRLKMLGSTLKHKVDLEEVGPDTKVPDEYLDRFADVAAEVMADRVR